MVFHISVPASAESPRRKMVVITADRTGTEILQADMFPGISRMIKSGAVGLMVTKTLQTGSKEAAHTTLGSGLRAEHSDLADLSFNIEEKYNETNVSDIYTSRAGVRPYGRVVNIAIGRLININQKSEWLARPGTLGTLLKDSGYTTAVLGNSDYDIIFSRNAVMVAMDERGTVVGGDVSRDILASDVKAPWGVKMDPNTVLEAFKKCYDKFDFIVIEYGDVFRAEQFADVALADPAAWARQQALGRLDRLVLKILDTVDLKTTQVILLAPTPPKQAISNKDTLTPIVIAGAGIEKGILTSASTRRGGLVLNTDFAPHVADFFGAPRAVDFIGSKITSLPQTDPAPFLVDMAAKDSFVERQSGALQGVVVWHLAMLAFCLIASIKLRTLDAKWKMLLNATILFTSTMFLSFLIVAAIPVANSLMLYYAAGIMICVVLSFATSLFRGAEARIIFLSAVYMAFLCGDQLTGANLIKNSVLGYYPQLGARFYGIGNEYMGFLVSAPALILGLAMDIKKEWAEKIKKLALPIFAISVIVVGSPNLGANFGGFISCATSAFFMIAFLNKGAIKGKTIILSVFVVAALTIAMVALDVMVLGGKTHIGQLVTRVLSGGGAAELIIVITRKLATNLRLLRFSTWSVLFIISLVVGAIAHYIPFDKLKKLFAECDGFRKAYVASLFGAVAAFVFNDSGIVPGATALVLPNACLFLLVFSREHFATLIAPEYPKEGD